MAFIDHLAAFDVVESIIQKNNELSKKYSNNNKLFDFVPGDSVKCTYLQGVFKVSGFSDSKVVIKTLDNSKQEIVGPNFLEKVDLDKRWVKVLYNNGIK